MTFGRVLRTEVIPDGQAGEAVLQMDDQPFAGKYLQRRRWIKIAARSPPIRRRAADHFIIEQEKVIDRCSYCIELCLPLSCRESNFKHTVLARQHNRLAELGSDCEVCSRFRSLRPGCHTGAFKRQYGDESTDYEQS